MKRLFLVFIIVGMLIVGCDSGDETPDLLTPPDTITFGDSNVEEAVHNELRIPTDKEITPEDLLYLTHLRVDEKGVKDLSNLEHCVNLGNLMLEENSIVDISPLASLTNLQSLVLYDNLIADISPLASLTNLQQIYLSYNSIVDISPLASLTNLQQLWLAENSITDISPLASLTNLQQLRLSHNSITDISPLVANSGLSNGDYVSLSDNPLSDTSLNSYIPQLEERGVVVQY